MAFSAGAIRNMDGSDVVIKQEQAK